MSNRGTLYVRVIIDLNRCSLTYGQAPCTASLTPGFQCTNSFATCQDKPNYAKTTEQLILCSNNMFEQFLDEYPCLVDFPKHTSTEIKRGDGVAIRGGVDIIATDWAGPEIIGNANDPYLQDRGSQDQGTFWAKFRARFPYYDKNKVTVQYWAQGDVSNSQLIRSYEYRLERIDGPDKAGKVRLRCRDILTAIDDDAAQIPQADSAVLASSINPTATSFDIVNFNPDAWPTGGGHLKVEDEAMAYTSFNPGTGTLSGVTRGFGETRGVSHDAGEPATVAIYYDTMNVVDLIYDLLTKVALIDQSYIPYTFGVDPTAQWDAEREVYLSGHNITQLLVEPSGVASLLDELCEQCYINLWADPSTSEIYISAKNTTLAAQSAQPFTEELMLEGSQVLKENRKRMFTQSWCYYGQDNILENSNPSDYRGVDIQVNTELESDNSWGQKRVNVILGTWLYQGSNIALITNSRLIDERSEPEYELQFETDSQFYPQLRIGTFVNLSTSRIQTFTGAPQPRTWQVVKLIETVPTSRIQVTLASIPPITGTQRFGNIVNVANESVEYGDATPADRNLWGWIAGLDGFENKDDPYLMI